MTVKARALGVVIALASACALVPASAAAGSDAYPAWLSYGGNNVLGTYRGWDAIDGFIRHAQYEVTWRIPAATSFAIHAYVRNIGSAPTAPSTRVRFCLSTAAECLVGSGTLSTVSTGAVAAGGKRFASSISVALPEGPRQVTACVLDAGDTADRRANDCTTALVRIGGALPVDWASSYMSLPVCAAQSCPYDGYGLASYAGPVMPFGELPASRPCTDGKDNDGDGFIDAADRGCLSPEHTTEYQAERPICAGDTETLCNPHEIRRRTEPR